MGLPKPARFGVHRSLVRQLFPGQNQTLPSDTGLRAKFPGEVSVGWAYVISHPPLSAVHCRRLLNGPTIWTKKRMQAHDDSRASLSHP